jgi:uncharacterized protein
VRRFDYIVQAVARAGAKKVIFGSDGPWLHPGLELHKIRLLGLPPEQEALILGGNVLRLLHQARLNRQFIDRSPAIRLQPPPGAYPDREAHIRRQLPPPVEVEHEL